MAGRVGLALALAAGLAALAVLALSQDHRLAGTNDVPPVLPIATLEARRAVCQAVDGVPAGTGGIAVLVAPAQGPPATLLAELRRGRRGVATGRGSVAAAGGWTAVALGRRVEPLSGEVCLRATRGAPVTVSGVASVPAAAARRARRALPGAVSVRFLRPGRESWLELAPTVAERAHVAKGSPLGPATLWGVAGLNLVLWAGSVRLLARRRR